MNKLLDKIFSRSNNLDYISKEIKNLKVNTPVSKIFHAVKNFSETSEIRYVGGCIRKIINKEKIDDIDLATNLNPSEVILALKKNNLNLSNPSVVLILLNKLYQKRNIQEVVQ